MYIVLAKSFDCATCDEAQSKVSEETQISVAEGDPLLLQLSPTFDGRVGLSRSNGHVAWTLKFRQVDIGQETAGVDFHCH